MKKFLAVLAFLAPMSAFGADNVLTWDDVTGEDGFTVYGVNAACSTAVLPFPPLSNIPANTLTFTHNTGTDDGFNWCYVVTSFNANGESGYSNKAGKVPAIPGTLRVN